MESRIRLILEREQLSSAEFADRIGVQRPSVSHVLSGRNKPSFQFIEKILAKFKHISARWLILGDGDMYQDANADESAVTTLFAKESSDEPDEPLLSAFKKEEKTKKIVKEPRLNQSDPVIRSSIRKVERILVFYDDKTFEEFTPGK